jgi:uracil-DNA glycosylase
MSGEADLIDLHADIEDDPALAHLLHGNRLVPGIGVYPTNVMVVGEAPGAVESTEQRPFCGIAGQVMFQLMGLAGLFARPEWSNGSEDYPETIGEVEANCWATYAVKQRPPGGRVPSWYEVVRMQPYLRREWAIVGKPRVMVAVGNTAWAAIGKTFDGVSMLAGQPMAAPGNRFVVPMYHPAYGLRNPNLQPKMERDWEYLGEWLREMDLL